MYTIISFNGRELRLLLGTALISKALVETPNFIINKRKKGAYNPIYFMIIAR